MARGDLPEQWAIPLHSMPDAIADVATTQREVQGTLGAISEFLKRQSAAIVTLQGAVDDGRKERAAMKSTIEALRSELNEARAQQTGTAELERQIRERCAKEVAKSHRAMLSTARAEVEKLGAAQLTQHAAIEELMATLQDEVATRVAELRAETAWLRDGLLSKAEAEDLAANIEAQEHRAVEHAQALADGLADVRGGLDQLREEALESLQQKANLEAVSKELDDVRECFARDTSELIARREVEALVQQQHEISATELRNLMEGKADVSAVEYALEDKLNCADAEAILGEMADLKAELGRVEITAVTAAQTAEVSTAELGAAIGLERVPADTDSLNGDSRGLGASAFCWSVSSSVITGRGVPVGSPAAALPRQQLLRAGGGADPVGVDTPQPQWSGAGVGHGGAEHGNGAAPTARGGGASVSQLSPPPIMNLFGGGTGAEGLWTWTGRGGTGHRGRSKSHGASPSSVVGQQVFLSAADAESMVWSGNYSAVSGARRYNKLDDDTITIGNSPGTGGLYMIAFGYFPKRLPAGRGARAVGPRKAWAGGTEDQSPHGGHNSIGAAAFSVLGSAETAPAVNPGGASVAGSGPEAQQELERTVTGVLHSSGVSPGEGSGSGQSCVRVVVDSNAAMDVKHFSTHTSPSHPATGATRLDFLNLQPGSKVRISCLGNAAEYGSAFLLLRHLG